MKHFFVAFTAVTFLSLSCLAQHIENITPISGYFFKNRQSLTKPVNTFVINNEGQFKRYFHIARTMNEPQQIDFSKPIAAIVLQPTNTEMTITIVDKEIQNNEQTIAYHIETGDTHSYTSIPTFIFQTDGPRKINFREQ